MVSTFPLRQMGKRCVLNNPSNLNNPSPTLPIYLKKIFSSLFFLTVDLNILIGNPEIYSKLTRLVEDVAEVIALLQALHLEEGLGHVAAGAAHDAHRDEQVVIEEVRR